MDGRMGGCSKPRCACSSYTCPMACNCGFPATHHRTTIETARERRAAGKRADNIGPAEGFGAAAGGAVTGFTSLLSGIERAKLHSTAMVEDEAKEAPPARPRPVRSVAAASSRPRRVVAAQRAVGRTPSSRARRRRRG